MCVRRSLIHLLFDGFVFGGGFDGPSSPKPSGDRIVFASE
jgi:hypothetical protein